MTKRERTCVLLLDKVQLHKKVEYDAGLKRLVRHVSPEFISNGKTEEIADHALMYMLKGLCTPNKQSIVRTSLIKSVTGLQLWQTTKSIIEELYAHNIIVRVVTSDMAASNVGIWKAAGININDSVLSHTEHPCNAANAYTL